MVEKTRLDRKIQELPNLAAEDGTVYQVLGNKNPVTWDVKTT